MYSQDSKDKALGMLRLTGDVEKTARMSGIPGRTLRRWAAAAAKPRKRSRGAKFEPYGDEVRGKAMEMARGGASCREIAEALGIGSPDVVRYWLKGGGTKEARMSGRSRRPEGDEPAYAGFEGSPEERIRQLELENDILRGAIDLLKAGSLDAMSNMEKAMLIDELRLETDRPLRELTGSLRISKSSYEYCRAKLRAKDRHARLRADIRRIFDGAGGRRGYRYVHNELREEGTVVSEKVVRRLMAEEGCRVAYLKRRRRYSSYRGEISDAPPNLVDRNFRAGGPNELWLTDITEFKLPSGEKAYLSPIIDCFDGLVVAWRIGRRPDAALANGSLEDACGTLAPGQHPVCHSDRGVPLQMARVDRHMRGKRPGPLHVEEGLQPGQLGMRGLLRPPEERVLLPSGLEGRRHGVVHGATGRVHPLLQRAPQEAVARLDEPHAVPDKQGTSRLGWSKELSAPPSF